MLRKTITILTVGLWLSAAGAILPIGPVDSAAAANCRNRGGSSERFSYSSQVNGKVFTLCGKAIFKYLVNRHSKSPATAKPTPKITARPKPPIANRPKKRSDDGTAAFTPRRPVASVEIESVQPQQLVEFVVDSTTHFRRARILGHSARVRFRPIEFIWSFSDSIKLTGASVSRSFANEGTYPAVAAVRFEVSYRFDAGAAWVVDPGRIVLVSNPVAVLVGSGAGGAVRLVNRNCLEISNAAGCRNP